MTVLACGFNPPSSGSFPKAPNPQQRRDLGQEFQSSFIWIIPESGVREDEAREGPTVSILLHLDHSRKPRPGRFVIVS